MRKQTTYINLGDFIYKEIGCSNRRINRFNETYDMNLIKYVRHDKPINMFGEVRNYHELNHVAQSILMGLKEDIHAYKKDFYASKTSIIIAERIDESSELVFKYVYKSTFSNDGLFFSGGPRTIVPYNDFKVSSEVRDISSFQILRDIQMDRRMNLLRKFNGNNN